MARERTCLGCSGRTARTPGLREPELQEPELQENGTWPLSTISTASRNGCVNSKRLLQRVRMKSPNWRNGAISQGKPHAPMSKIGEGAPSTIHQQGSGAHNTILRSRGMARRACPPGLDVSELFEGNSKQ